MTPNYRLVGGLIAAAIFSGAQAQGLDALKNGLAIMNGCHGWVKTDGSIGNNFGCLPTSIAVLCHQHMVCEMFAK